MKKVFFFLLTWLFLIEAQAQTSKFEGDKLINLIGKPRSAKDVLVWLQQLGEKNTTLSDENTLVYSEKGIKVGLYEGKWIDKVQLNDNAYVFQGIAHKEFPYKMPLGLTFSMNKENVLLKLGIPQKEGNTFVEYTNYDAIIRIFFDGNRIKSRVNRIIISYKSCISGDCMNGFGIHVDKNGNRYDGNWKDGKHQGDGKMVYANGSIQEGVWENGVYKGKNFFKSNRIYDLLGKHQDNAAVRNLLQNNKQGYRRISLAMDYAQYVFNDGKIKLFFNEYGYIYKITLLKPGFREYASGFHSKFSTSSDQNYVRYILGQPTQIERLSKGEIWSYHDGNYMLNIIFGTNKIIDHLEMKMLKDGYVPETIKGTCTNGDCNNGYGEYINEAGRYVGYFENGKFTGKGTFYFKTKGTYTGTFKNNMRHGNGTYVWSDGSRYEGAWEGNEREGKGIMIYPDKSKFVGDWKNDRRNGKGMMYYINGDKLQGEWRDDFPSGKSTLYKSEGKNNPSNSNQQ